MRKKKTASGDYKVGYGQPPEHTRFKPGQSGNPKGRPKRSQNLRSVLREALFKKVPVTEDGRPRTMSRVEAIVTGLVAKALKGDCRATESVLRLANQHFPPGEEQREKQIVVLRDPYADDDEDPWGSIRRQKRRRPDPESGRDKAAEVTDTPHDKSRDIPLDFSCKGSMCGGDGQTD